MPFCKSCAAPLPPYSSRCEYCGAKNDIDLRGVQEYTIAQDFSERKCPVCTKPMESISLKEISDFTIERCSECMGLFFDPDELNMLLDSSVAQVYSINLRKIWEMNQMEVTTPERSAVYIKCPICQGVMNRVNFGVRSGVVIDQCVHGVWLDSGELRKLLEWRKAGGQLYHETVLTGRIKQEELLKKKREMTGKESLVFSSSKINNNSFSDKEIELDKVFGSVAKVIWRLFT